MPGRINKQQLIAIRVGGVDSAAFTVAYFAIAVNGYDVLTALGGAFCVC
jgi:hypothetical protein